MCEPKLAAPECSRSPELYSAGCTVTKFAAGVLPEGGLGRYVTKCADFLQNESDAPTVDQVPPAPHLRPVCPFRPETRSIRSAPDKHQGEIGKEL